MNIVCTGFPAWEGDYIKSTVQLMDGLSARHRVLYVEYPFTWLDTLKPKQKPAARILGIKPRLRQLKQQLYVLTLPPFLPANSVRHEKTYEILNRYNAARAAKTIKWALAQLGWEPDVMVNALNPMLGVPLKPYFPNLPLVYYCYDEITAAPWLKVHGGPYEKRILRMADAVVCSSDSLSTDKSALARRVFTVKNGVDLDNFKQVSYQPNTQPTPIIGYLGSVDSRIDFSLLYTVASNIPKAKLVLVGRTNSDETRTLRSLPNVQFFGSMPPEQLPAVVQSFTVCLIPFICNKLTAGIYPMKINEYLACGKPVVSTHFTNLTEFGNLIYVADNHADFLYGVGQALATNQEVSYKERRDFAESNSWENRCKAFEEILQQIRIGTKAAPIVVNEKRVLKGC